MTYFVIRSARSGAIQVVKSRNRAWVESYGEILSEHTSSIKADQEAKRLQQRKEKSNE
jgi:hypothetical protein